MGAAGSREDKPGGLLGECCNSKHDKPDRNDSAIRSDLVQLHHATIEGDEQSVPDPSVKPALAASRLQARPAL